MLVDHDQGDRHRFDDQPKPVFVHPRHLIGSRAFVNVLDEFDDLQWASRDLPSHAGTFPHPYRRAVSSQKTLFHGECGDLTRDKTRILSTVTVEISGCVRSSSQYP